MKIRLQAKSDKLPEVDVATKTRLTEDIKEINMWEQTKSWTESSRYEAEDFEFVYHEIPERNLVAEVLMRGLRDVVNDGGVSQEETRDALGWIRAYRPLRLEKDAARPFSFVWCCLSLDLNPRTVRARVLDMKARGLRLLC